MRRNPTGGTAPAVAPTARDRRALGLVALVIAFVLLLGAPALLGHGTAGTANPAPLPLAPPVGSCVVFAGADRHDLTVVPCAANHVGEITMAWEAGTTAAARAGFVGLPEDFWTAGDRSNPHSTLCHGWNQGYVGRPTATARATTAFAATPPAFGSLLVTAPAAQRTPTRYWSACVVEPSVLGTRYVGRVQGTAADGSWPAAFARCLAQPAFSATQLIYTPCSNPHRAEPMGRIRGGLATGLAAVLHDDCVQLIRDRTGAADPAFGGRLTIDVHNALLRTLTLEQTAALPADLSSDADCVVELAGPGALVGSLVGIGSGALPVVATR